MSRIEKAINSLLINTKGEVFSRIEEISSDILLDGTNSKCYCYSLKTDANNNLRLKDLIEFIDERIVDYAIPKEEIDKAYKYQTETGSSSKILRLRKQALSLFTNLKQTGEGGEILLYILAIEILKIPQLISKMSLKTSGQLHYQGSDGIHVKYNDIDNKLELFWGESKMYENINTAISKCFDSLKGFLLDSYSYSSTQERDLVLITQNIKNNVNNEEFENLIVKYFDKDSDLSNSLVYKGICFIGYDMKSYKELNISKTSTEINDEIKNELTNHYLNISKKIKKHQMLDKKEIHVFLMPFPSVKEFRKYYLETLNI